jgi:hypothetical protein
MLMLGSCCCDKIEVKYQSTRKARDFPFFSDYIYDDGNS